MSPAILTLIIMVPVYIVARCVAKSSGNSWGIIAGIIVMAFMGGLEVAIVVVILTALLLWLGSFFK